MDNGNLHIASNAQSIRSSITSAGLFIITLLWSYAVFSKFADLRLYVLQMKEQPFPILINNVLVYLVPILELAAAVLLILNKHKSGLWLSLCLLLSFSIYILLILIHFFPTTPCSCGGFISKMSWENHLYFNAGLVAVNLFCLYQITIRERRSKAQQA